MELNKIILISIFIISSVLSQENPDNLESPETNDKPNKTGPLQQIISKQALYNIRFVSNDSSFTIYQKHTGGLFLSTNYSVKKILDSTENSQFTVLGKQNIKNIIISKKEGFHSEFNPNKDEEIYVFPYNLDGDAQFIGSGINPQFHLNGEYISYVNKSENKLIIQKLSLPKKSFELTLPESPNPFFMENTIIPNENTILISWQNSSGINELIKTDFEAKNIKILKKLNSYFSKIEMCLIDNNIYVFENNYIGQVSQGSFLSMINEMDAKETKLYSSNFTDLGQINCNIEKDYIYFIKNFSETEKYYFDVAKINLKTKEILRLTNEDYITNIFEMDGRLIAVNNGEQMLLIGENSLKNDSIPALK